MSNRAVCKFLVFSALLLIGGSAFADDCTNLQAGGIFDTVVNNFSSNSGLSNGGSWLGNAENYAKNIFWGLAGIEFAWAAVTWVLRKNSMGEYLTSLVFKLMSISFFFWIISYAPTWIPLVLQGFQKIAAGISGSNSIPTVATGMISPSAVMGNGVCVIKAMYSPFQQMGGFELLKQFMPALAIVVASMIIAICYFIITLQLVLTEIEAFIVLSSGMVLLGFTGSRWTAPWGEKFFGYAVSVGVKLMVIYLVITMGNSVIVNDIIKTMNIATNNGSGVLPNIVDFAQIIITTLVYAGLAWTLPSLAGTFLNGSPNMSMGNMAGPAMAAAGVVAGAAALFTRQLNIELL